MSKLSRLIKKIKYLKYNKIQKAFQKVYDDFVWNSPGNNGESRSGEGSTAENTQLIREALTGILSEFKIEKMLDASCGDWNWMKELVGVLPNYLGLDVTPSVIARNKKKYGTKTVKFKNIDSLTYLKKCKDKSFDLILIRHTCEHLPTEYNVPLLKEIKRCAKCALITSSKMYTDETNKTTEFGGCKPINLLLTPYIEIVGAPMREIDDHIASGEHGTSYIYLYEF